jgi:hypothetical protein
VLALLSGVYTETTKWRRSDGSQIIKAGSDTRVVLRGDQRLTDDEIATDVMADPQVRVRYKLECPHCRRTVPLRGENSLRQSRHAGRVTRFAAFGRRR